MASKPAPESAPAPSTVVAAARKGSAAKSRGGAGDWLKGWIVPIILFLVFRTFIAQAYRIPSPSMVPEMLVGDWLFVNNLVYGPHVPFTDINLPGYAEPKRQEIAVFKSPYQADEAQVGRDPEPTLVKRVWGLGGDTLMMRKGVLSVNGTEYPWHKEQSQGMEALGDLTDPLFEWQHTIEIKGTHWGEPPAVPTHDNWGPLVVPKDHLFMLGDNRYESKDSRYWGVVPRKNLRGRPIFVYYSYNGADSDRALPFLTDIRWGRIGHVFK